MRSEEITICLVGSVERVERVEELLLEPFLALHELDVVDEQHVDVAVAALERLAVVLVRMASTYSLRKVSVET
jgi:hypothetical protein